MPYRGSIAADFIRLPRGSKPERGGVRAGALSVFPSRVVVDVLTTVGDSS